MTHHGPTIADILAGKTANAMPSDRMLPQTELRNYFQAIDNMMKVFAIRPDDKVLFLTDPLLDRRVVDAIAGIARGRGVQTREFMAPTTQLTDCPDEARALVEDATFVIGSWYASVNAPLFMKLSSDASAGRFCLLPVAGPRLFGATSLPPRTSTRTLRF